jgi:hypothetical protein
MSQSLGTEAAPALAGRVGITRRFSQGGARSSLALIVDPKLFAGGEESPPKLSPQPTVNNFAVRLMPTVNKVNLGARAPWSRRTGKTNGLALYVATSEPRLSLPVRRLSSKRTLKKTTLNVSFYKDFAEPKPACPLN